MKKVIIIFVVVITAISALSCMTPAKDKINWISMKELNEVYYKNPKPILVDIYTSWCGWCKEMDRTTYKNEKLATYVNEHYYAVRFDAESTDSFIFNNKTYGYNAKDKSNELAEFLLFGRMEFPTTVFLSTIDAKPVPLAGYMKPKEIEAPLKFFGEGAYASQTFVEFEKGMKREW